MFSLTHKTRSALVASGLIALSSFASPVYAEDLVEHLGLDPGFLESRLNLQNRFDRTSRLCRRFKPLDGRNSKVRHLSQI